MSTEHNDTASSDLEQRLRAGAPAKRDAAMLARVRASISRSTRRGFPVLSVAAAAVALIAVTSAVLWGGRVGTEPSLAFAYDRAAEMIAPEDGVLHVVIASYDVTGADETSTTPDVANEDEPFVSESWLDPGREMARIQIGSESSSYTLRIETPDRILCESRDICETQPNISEWVVPSGFEPTSVESLGWLKLGWMRTFASAIEGGSCEVTESVTADGAEVWRVTWGEQVDGGVIRNEALFRRSDYRPLSIIRHNEYDGGSMLPEGDGALTAIFESSVTRTEVEIWEILPRDEVPAEVFETRADLGRQAASFDVYMAQDDPRIAQLGFPVWSVSEDAGFGSRAFVNFRKGDIMGFELESAGAFTLQYGEATMWYEPGAMFAPDVVSITTFASNDRQDVDQYWANHVVGTVETSGEVDGHSYQMRAGEQEGALLLARVDGTVVVITAPDADTALAVLGKLEPLQ